LLDEVDELVDGFGFFVGGGLEYGLFEGLWGFGGQVCLASETLLFMVGDIRLL